MTGMRTESRMMINNVFGGIITICMKGQVETALSLPRDLRGNCFHAGLFHFLLIPSFPSLVVVAATTSRTQYSLLLLD